MMLLLPFSVRDENMFLYNSPYLFYDVHQENSFFSLYNNSRSILNSCVCSIGDNVHNNNDSSYTDIHNSNSRRTDAMDASNWDNIPSTRKSARQNRWEEI